LFVYSIQGVHKVWTHIASLIGYIFT